MAEDDTSIRTATNRPDDDSSSFGPANMVSYEVPAVGDSVVTLAPVPPAAWPDDKTVISKRPPLAPDAAPAPPASYLLGTTLVGTRLEHYQLDEFVGGGGMGAVFRATDTRLGRTVAVKVLSRDHTDEETVRRFRNEAQSAARLDHPNIARAYYVGEDHGWNFIVFEFVEGANLRDEIEEAGPLELEQALHYTLQIAEALAHSSSRDVIHRDIKPSNVLVTSSGEVKLVDMGLARQPQVDSDREDLTASGVMLGTFDYISPEQARDPRSADVRSDIYSLGCTLFFMLTGQPPFPDGTAVQKLLRHNSDEPPDVRTFRPELHPRVSALVSKMLAKRPAQRHQDAAALIAEIVGLGQQLGLPSVAKFSRIVVVPVAAPASWWSKTWQIAGAAALLALVLAVLEFVVAPPPAGGDVMPRARFKPRLEAPPIAADKGLASVPVPPATSAEQNSVAAPGGQTAEEPGPEALGPLTPRSEWSLNSLLPSAPPPSDAAPTSAPLPATDAPSRREPRDASVADAHAIQPQRMVVIGDGLVPDEPLTEFVTSLAEACSRAAELGLTEIELRYSGERSESPLEIASQRLKVRASEGHRPQLVFRPHVQVGEPHMIRLAGGSLAHVQFEGVDLRLELPSDAPAAGWALFGMSTGQSLDLTSCVLTVQDGDASRLPLHDQVAVVAVQRRRSADVMSMPDAQLAMGQQARLNLERTIARGEANLVCLTDETPLTIHWNQGLLVTSQRLLATGGAASEPQYYEQIVLDLHNVTAYCRAGLYYLHRGPGKAHQFHVLAYTDRCLFVSEPGVPLFEMVGLTAPPEEDQLQSTGEGNRFSPADMPFLMVRATPASEPQIFKLGRRWSSEPRSQAGVLWTRPPPLDRPLHELSKDDFDVADDGFTASSGFDPGVLPQSPLGISLPRPAIP